MSVFAILKLPDLHTRIAVALVVWYDECGNDEVTERNSMYDCFLNHPQRNLACQKVSRKQVYDGLIAIGWSHDRAKKRLALDNKSTILIASEKATPPECMPPSCGP